MKKIIVLLSIILVAASCGKSTKGKMDGEWKIDSLKSVTTSTSGGNTESNTLDINGTMVTITDTDGGITSSATGVVNTAFYNINKDGTWDSELTFTISQTISGTDYTQVSTIKNTGTWDFAKGIGEFKKNERVLFTTLTQNNTQATTANGITSTSSSNETYLEGENTTLYVIEESKKKSLQMSSVGSSNTTYTSGGMTSSSSETSDIQVKFVLE